MKVQWFQHAPFEGLGAIEEWLLERGHTLSCTRFYADEVPPVNSDGFDWLIVMGGPMNVYQYDTYPWLSSEKHLIREAITAGKRVLGICLGAQLIADVLGGEVYPNDEREIGWFPVRAVSAGASSSFAFPEETAVFHWHGDTFSLPPDSVWLAESDGCAHQAFAVGTHVLGLQFHLEMTATGIGGIAQACAGELTPGRYVQPAEIIISQAKQNEPVAKLLGQLLTVLERG